MVIVVFPLTYGLTAWVQATKTHQNKLLLLQKHVLRMIFWIHERMSFLLLSLWTYEPFNYFSLKMYHTSCVYQTVPQLKQPLKDFLSVTRYMVQCKGFLLWQISHWIFTSESTAELFSLLWCKSMELPPFRKYVTCPN